MLVSALNVFLECNKNLFGSKQLTESVFFIPELYADTASGQKRSANQKDYISYEAPI